MSAVSLARYGSAARKHSRPVVLGRLCEVLGLLLKASGCRASVGDIYRLETGPGQRDIEAEVVGVRGEETLLMALGETQGLEIGTPLRRIGSAAAVPVGLALRGRVIDALGRPLDGGPPLALSEQRSLYGSGRNPLLQRPLNTVFPTGVRVIDGLLTLAVGQRIGIFAGAGVGKSSLLALLVRQAQADVAVVALIGERGREVQEFVHQTLGPAGLARAVVVAATGAQPPLLRVRGALYATTIAEHYRALGQRVLLVMDSLTRFAMAAREVGLAAGEPAVSKGYTPSVFAALPQLLERAGSGTGPGSITGVYTVLVEGDDLNDPVADTVRAILDGHIVLDRALAERGHFPAVNVPRSISRVMAQVTEPVQQALARQVRALLAAHQEAEDLLAIGMYQRGTVPKLDRALRLMPQLEAFLQQSLQESSDVAATLAQLQTLLSE